MYTVKPTTKFQKDLKRVQRRGYDINLLLAVLITLAAGKALDAVYNDHPLKGKYEGCRECHITPDWLLIYKVSGDSIFLFLTRTGTHSDLF
jgi:mRNA interferase YafQ